MLVNGTAVSRIAKDNRVIEMSDEKNRVTRYEYDQWDNLIKTIFPDGTFVENQYDPAAHLITQKTDEKGVTTRYTYTALGLLRGCKPKPTEFVQLVLNGKLLPVNRLQNCL